MNIQIFTPLNSLLQSIFIVFFVVVVVRGRSSNTSFDVCEQFEPKNCGKGPNINYPFWILNSNNSHCGNPKFAVTCDEQNHTIIDLSGEEYIIKDVFYSNNSFLIANSKVYNDLFTYNYTCPIPLHNFTLNDTPFEYSPSTFDIFFFYNCTQNPIDPAYNIPCENNNNSSLHSFVVYHEEKLLHNNFSIESCESLVNAPIEAADISVLLNMNFTDVLRNGFVLQWNDSLCSRCVRSGGDCRYNSTGEFICSCSGQSHSETCPENGKSLIYKSRLFKFKFIYLNIS
ncbi:LEAF RUST 10 DISEASE-RESISTANCE LOCUS RECEPTOR-LIKE PROTEIN KINASE-like 1.2 [Impatiens glandulifera]|uniref:LEAF RUST 10 DISEASE-RESISTANCE LOCUS RECEPTOR-LIKE PROTEIN KINASE-like 1.2 n=1 Tax=Impatiens glandulifera TaxID=253017 RepID=UPI001FB1011C|nr:LEAF RUST 10 DISEASE-RESISTANCE LOCUS RECEPTOR-LIKE PROTEIN KINASE-like 1.2 [Impatiens glandulifera]